MHSWRCVRVSVCGGMGAGIDGGWVSVHVAGWCVRVRVC
jgi:hypothetical protein